MKLLLISYIIVLLIFSIETHKLLLVGFNEFNYKTTDDNKTEFSYDILFKKNMSFSEYDILYNNVTISTGTKNEAIQLNCSKKEGGSNDDLSYTCSNKTGLNLSDSNTNLIASKKFIISNGSENIDLENETLFSSLIDKTIDNIQKQNKKLSYSTYYLNNVTNVKNSFTLIGINAQNLNDALASFDLGEQNYNLTINETQITFTVKEYIDEHLNGKMGKIIKDNNTNNGDEYILLYKNDSIVPDLARYISPNSKLFVEVIGAGNFVQDSKHNAKGNIYISGLQNY